MKLSKRIRYFFVHLACSLLVGVALLTLVFLVWYPAPLASAEGVTTIFLMLLVIDVILGPLLSLLVYKEGKKNLKMDLSIIVLIQVVAMGYGIYAIAQSRPAWIVQAGWLFEIVPANVVDTKDQKQADPAYQHNSWLQPKWVAVDDAKNPNNLFAAPQLMPTTYNDLSYADQRLKQHAQTLASLQQFNTETDIQNVLKDYPTAKYWMPLRATGVGLTVLLDSEYKVIQAVDLRPWRE
ncbi:TfpX/TfpZ family type IV pilin accessory protein [Acinetobacter sp. YH12140]|uniref:TfpX/TfpZ family type IV pilin accessory protein n=1 Tax=Acinetobacter sp. YH12140 TaxID=2601124 RepID=UPI0015D401A1|nr:TfpX/TfpZ family type IV pilin accessory protein [Acinetobacter sp. YH12140]